MLRYGLQVAVEAKVLADVNGTSGIQSQTYATSVLTTLRKGITKLEVAGYSPAAFALHPTDFEDVALALSAQNAIEHLGLPYNPANRQLYGVPVVTANAQAAGGRARIRQRLNRFGHRHARCRRAMVGECYRRLVWQEPRVCAVRK